MNRLPRHLTLAVLTVTGAASCAPADADRSARVHDAYLEIVAAEDVRPSSGPALRLLVTEASSDNRFLRAAAIRALGRLENPEIASEIENALADPAPEVRAEAANALAQAYFRTDGTAALAPLLDRVAAEHDEETRGVVAASLGRLTLDPIGARRAADALIEMSYAHGRDAPGAVMLGVALGIDALSRSTRATIVPGRVARRLDDLRRYEDRTRTREQQHRVRALAISVLASAGLLNREQLRIALRDESPIVKAAGARAVGSLDPEWYLEGLRMIMFSRSIHAQVEGLRFMVNQPRTAGTCRYLMDGVRVPPPGVVVPTALRVLAIDALAQPCPDLADQRAALSAAASPDQIDSVHWQPAAHALVSLATLDPSRAANILPAHAGSANAFVRAYAARAAGIVGDRNTLRALLQDLVPNVRTEALRGLARLDGRGADRAAIGQLESDDPQLVMAAAAALSGTEDPDVGAALVDALDRMSEARRETFRDARRALLERLAETGDESLSERLIPYLSDYDPLVADDVAEVLQSWNGRPYFPTPVRPERQPLPTVEDLTEMAASVVVLHMQGLGEIHIELHPYVSTTNTWRFFRQARDGYFDGLTFHRWSPGFVIQGGSPNANEYYGDGPFSRDEVGMHHWRGTVGISTRGHDTGDGQIFVNLMDNTRLDHQYTIVGTVTEGLDVVDQVNAGGVIERAEVRPAR